MKTMSTFFLGPNRWIIWVKLTFSFTGGLRRFPAFVVVVVDVVVVEVVAVEVVDVETSDTVVAIEVWGVVVSVAGPSFGDSTETSLFILLTGLLVDIKGAKPSRTRQTMFVKLQILISNITSKFRNRF